MLARTVVIFICVQNAIYRALECSDTADQISISLKGDDLERHISPLRNVTEKSLPMDNAIESDTFEIMHRQLHDRKITFAENIISKVKRAVVSTAINDTKNFENVTQGEIITNGTNNFEKKLLQKNVASNFNINKNTAIKHKATIKIAHSSEDNTTPLTVIIFLFALFVVATICGVIYYMTCRSRPQTTNTMTSKCKNTAKTRQIEYRQVATEEPCSSKNSTAPKSISHSKGDFSTCNKSEIRKLSNSPIRVTPIPTHSTSSTKTRNSSTSATSVDSSSDDHDTRDDEIVDSVDEELHDEGQNQNLSKSGKLCSKCNGCMNTNTIVKKINEVEQRGGRIHIPISIPVEMGADRLRTISISSPESLQPLRSRASTLSTSTNIDSSSKGKDEEYVLPRIYGAQLKQDHDRHSSCSASTAPSFQDDESKYDYVESEGPEFRKNSDTSVSRPGRNYDYTMSSAQDQRTVESQYEICSSSERSVVRSNRSCDLDSSSRRSATTSESNERCWLTGGKSSDQDAQSDQFEPSTTKSNELRWSTSGKSSDYSGQSDQRGESTIKSDQTDICTSTVSTAKCCDHDQVNSFTVSTVKSNDDKVDTFNASAAKSTTSGSETEYNTRPTTICTTKLTQNGNYTTNRDDSYSERDNISTNESVISDISTVKSSQDCSCTEICTFRSNDQCIDTNIKSQIGDFHQHHGSTVCDTTLNSHRSGISFKAPLKIKVLSTDPDYDPSTLVVKQQLNKLLANRTNDEEPQSRLNRNIKEGQVIYADICFVKQEAAYASTKPARETNGSDTQDDSSACSIVKHYKNTPSECENNYQYDASRPSESDDCNFSTYKDYDCKCTSEEKNYESRGQYQECTASVCSNSTSQSNLFKKFGNGVKKSNRSTKALKYCSSVDSGAGLIRNLNQRLKGVYLSGNGSRDQSRRSSVSRCTPVSEYPTDLENDTYEAVESPYEIEDIVRSSRSGMHNFLPRIRQYMSKRRRSNSAVSFEDTYYSEPSVNGKPQICHNCLKYLPDDVGETIKSKKPTLESARQLAKGRSTLHLDEIIKLYPDLRSQLSPGIKEALSKSSDDLYGSYYSPLCENYERGRENRWSELSTSFENLKCLR